MISVDSYCESCGVIRTVLPSRSMIGSSRVDEDGRTGMVQDGPQAGAR